VSNAEGKLNESCVWVFFCNSKSNPIPQDELGTFAGFLPSSACFAYTLGLFLSLILCFMPLFHTSHVHLYFLFRFNIMISCGLVALPPTPHAGGAVAQGSGRSSQCQAALR
jgi:hypothetical protein